MANKEIMNLINNDGAFIKMHRSPKDADYGETDDPEYFRVKSVSKLILLLCLSLRIAEDLEEYLSMKRPMKLFISPFKAPIYDNEYRIFVRDGQFIGFARLPPYDGEKHDERKNDESVQRTCLKAFTEHSFRSPRSTYCMDIEVDIEVLEDEGYRLFEFNPLDEWTDLYGFEMEF